MLGVLYLTIGYLKEPLYHLLLNLKPFDSTVIVSHPFPFPSLSFFPLSTTQWPAPRNHFIENMILSDHLTLIQFEKNKNHASWHLCVWLENNSRNLGQPDLRLLMSSCAFLLMCLCAQMEPTFSPVFFFFNQTSIKLHLSLRRSKLGPPQVKDGSIRDRFVFNN